MKKHITALLLALLTIFTFAPKASAKTTESAKADIVFVYAVNSEEKSVLLKVIPLADLKKLSHGQLKADGGESGDNYYISATDNYPTTQYVEGRGVTVPELISYVKSVTSVSGASAVGFAGDDKLYLMATDSYGAYNRSWTYRELYGVDRYYFEGMLDGKSGWKPGWEIAGEDSSKFGVTLEEYSAKYAANDPFYTEKRAVFASGVKTVPILATESFSGRTTSDSLSASTEVGIADYIAKNGGKASGCLKSVLTDETALRLSLPITEADLMAAHRTAYDNFKWTYNLKLDMVNNPKIASLGSVDAPVASFAVSGDKLTIRLSCQMEGASIYYGFDGAPQTLYKAPIEVDIKDVNLSANPVTLYAAAVKEGFDDAGIKTYKYPGLAPAFKTQYTSLIGKTVAFEPADGVSAEEWNGWYSKLSFVTMKLPSSPGYSRVDSSKISALSGKLGFALSADLFTETGAYGFVFHVSGYADKSVSLTVKNGSVEISEPKYAVIGAPLLFRFSDPEYQTGLSMYVTPPDGKSAAIPTSALDRSLSGRTTVKASYFDSPSCAVTVPGRYKFTFINSRYEPGTIELNVDITEKTLASLSDVGSGDWFLDAVRFNLAAGLLGDAGGGRFMPNITMSRAMTITVLARYSGIDTAGGETWSSKAVEWAKKTGVSDGGDLDGAVTREQLVTMIWRLLEKPSGSGNLSVFSDAASISDWAEDAMVWAVGAGIINGGDARINPRGTASRAQAAQILFNWLG